MMNDASPTQLSEVGASLLHSRSPRFRLKWQVIAGLVVLLAIAGCTFLWLPRGNANAANAAVSFADSHWNCATAACTSRVSAGSAQPYYQCAEFVARALATEGLIPGLSASSSQSAYGSYHARNGKTYDLLWVGWAYGGWDGQGLYQYLIQNGVGTDIGNHPSQASPGDVTIYFEGAGHTALLVETGSSPKVDAHNNARYHVGYTEGYSLTIVHIGHVSSPPPPPPSGVGGWPTEQYGNTGRDVESIQLLLQAHGYSLTADGDFGPITRTDVEAFQRAHGLSVDGVVGPHTWAALVVTTQYGSSGVAVKALQKQLNAHGYNLVVDGSFGPATRSAVENYQSHHELVVDGIAGPYTWQSLVQ